MSEPDQPQGREKYYARILRPVDIDKEFDFLLLVVKREIRKLLDLSYEEKPLCTKDHEVVIAYTRLLGNLKKQMSEDLRNMDPEEVKRIAHADNG